MTIFKLNFLWQEITEITNPNFATSSLQLENEPDNDIVNFLTTIQSYSIKYHSLLFDITFKGLFTTI